VHAARLTGVALVLTMTALATSTSAQTPARDTVACYSITYDSAQHGAAAALFPDHFVLIGSDRGRVSPRDSSGFWRVPRTMADWFRYDGKVYVNLEGSQDGARFILLPAGDTLRGMAEYTTDVVSPRPKSMVAVAVREPCSR
jgi:hypothetical protein